ncbi:MAG: hypothetical protein R6X12_07690 [bacterium]
MRRTTVLLAVLCVAAFAAGDAVMPQTGTHGVPIDNRQATGADGLDAVTIPRMMSYQGRLTDTLGVPVPNGSYSVVFRLYTQPSGGSAFWTETQSVTTEDGLFAVLLGSVTPVATLPDAGTAYLGMAVAGGAELTPRLRIVSAAYAYLSERAASADQLQGKDTTGFVRTAQANSVTSAMIVNGTIAAADLGQMGAGTGQVLKWTGAAWAPRNDSVGGGGTGDSAWVRADSVLYTIRNLGIARGGARNMLHGNQAFTHVNLGIACTTGESGQNRYYATVSGGQRNTASGDYAMVGGGWYNSAGDFASTVSGGRYNTVSGNYATAGGGQFNTANGLYATVGGGSENTASAHRATVGGGSDNEAADTAAVVAGGRGNSAGAKCAAVSGGTQNQARGNYAAVGGGYGNYADGASSVVVGGTGNNAAGDRSSVTGGEDNSAAGALSHISGGSENVASARWATVGGGNVNEVTDTAATISGGRNNSAGARYATVGGGRQNAVSGVASTVGGGYVNSAIGHYSVVSGGEACTSSAAYSFAVGGLSRAIHSFSAVFNGQTTTASNQTRVGALSKASGTFTIDHPLDPHGRILNHYFIEGPEMLNIYRGSVTLDGSGRAEVSLPDYFSALNRSPHVQLTGVGTNDVVYIAEDVSGNRFTIGGSAGTKVYWQVTGERKDVSAEATRRMMPVEQPKSGALADRMLDDEFLSGCMDQLVREGNAQGIEFRTAAGRERYRRTQQHLHEAELERGR